MDFSPITNKKEIKAAFDALRSCLMAGAKKFRRDVGWPGGHGECTLHWHQNESFWALFEVKHNVINNCAFDGFMVNRFHETTNYI